jgi:general secretion pathway protein J
VASSVTFVRSAIGPNASAGLEVVRIAETDDARGLVLVRSRAPFVPGITPQAIDSGEVELTNPVVLVRPPFRVSFAFAGRDRVSWREAWYDARQLPAAIRITVSNASTDESLPFSTDTSLNVNVPAECVRKTTAECGGGPAGMPLGQGAG